MRIQRLSTAIIEANYDWVLVRLDGPNGLFGIGEAYMGPGVPAILREMASLVVGMDATRPDLLVHRLRAHTVHASPGSTWHAIAGIETACLDLLGKNWNRSVADLLGGAFRSEVSIYADCHAGEALESMDALLQPRKLSWMGQQAAPEEGADWADPEPGLLSLKHHGWDKRDAEFPTVDAFRIRAVEMAGRGFRALKFDADIPTPYPTDEYNRSLSAAEIEYVVERLRAVREAIGSHVGLAVDCHWTYNVADVCRLIRALEDLNLLWLEDPIPPDAIGSLAQVQQSTSTPIATGENHYFAADFAALLRDGMVRVVAPDVQKIGPTQTRDIGRMAQLHAASLALHNISGPVGFLAAVQTAATIPNCLLVEWHGASVPFFNDLVNEGPLIENGLVRLPVGPGLGVTLNEEIALKYAKPGEPFF